MFGNFNKIGENMSAFQLETLLNTKRYSPENEFTKVSRHTNKDKVISFLLLTLPADGASKVILNLAQGFIERGFKVDLVVTKAEGEALAWVPPGVRVVELKTPEPQRLLHKFTHLVSLIRYLRKEQPAVLFHSRGDINFASIAKFLTRVRTQVVVICHSNLSQYFQVCPACVRNSPTAYLWKKFMWFYNWADAIVTVSQGIADQLVCDSSRPLKRVQAIYNPVVTPELFEKAKQPVVHPWFAPGEPPVIISVGRFQALKDFPTLIQAFALVRQHIPARLMILGDGEERPQLEVLVSELGLTEEIALPGFATNPYAYMSKSAVCVMSSMIEGLPTVLIEAIAVGTPVVSTDCPSGPAEILDNGKYGKLVPIQDVEALANAIITTLTTPVDTEALQQQSHKFSLETAVNSYVELIASLGVSPS